MKVSSKRPRIESSTGASRPSTPGDPIAEKYVDPIAAVDPPSSSSSNTSLRSMLDIVMTIQAAHG